MLVHPLSFLNNMKRKSRGTLNWEILNGLIMTLKHYHQVKKNQPQNTILTNKNIRIRNSDQIVQDHITYSSQYLLVRVDAVYS